MSDDASKETGQSFDIFRKWEANENERASFLKRLLGGKEPEKHVENETQIKDQTKDGGGVELIEKDDIESSDGGEGVIKPSAFSLLNFLSKKPAQKVKNEQMGTDFISLLGGNGPSNDSSVDDIIIKARKLTQGDDSTKTSLSDLLQTGKSALERLDKTMTNFFGDEKPPPIRLPSVYYWSDHEDAVKNFAWKRRKHRFCPALEISRVEELDRKLHFANLCYADTLEEIKVQLEETFNYELLFCEMESQANRPSHFIAIQRDQLASEKALEVTMVIRGTKTITDVITDILCEEAEYRGGTAHAGMLESGQYLSQKHKSFLRELCDLSSKPKIKLTIIGHSLGAGAAAIAGIELNDEDFIDVQVFGFGAPATLSKEISESTKDFITCIVSDSDCVPRMSAATMANAVLDMGEYDWIPDARNDIQAIISHIHACMPAILKGDKEKMMKSAEKFFLGSVKIPEPTSKRMIPTLFPPGECIHFYRDGFGMSAVVVPCTFFDQLDINRRMVDDHLYYSGYKQVFLELMRQHHQNHYFLFETDRLINAKTDSSK